MTKPHIHQNTFRFHKLAAKTERGLPPNRLVPELRASVDEFRQLLPVVAALRNPALKPRHWARAAEAAEAAGGRRMEMGVEEEGFTLQVGWVDW
jgi:dynein heavy chain